MVSRYSNRTSTDLVIGPVGGAFETAYNALFRTAVARNRDKRFQSARQFADELRALLHPTATTTVRAETPQRNCPRTLLSLAIDDEPRLI